MISLEKIKPSVKRRTLLLIAGCAWSIAGLILLYRGSVALPESDHPLIRLIAAVFIGYVFYVLLFMRISGKHISRIFLISIDNPCFFSFFNLRSYALMAVMITAGITLRMLDLIPKELLYPFYMAMGLPLLLSARRFFYSWYKNKPS